MNNVCTDKNCQICNSNVNTNEGNFLIPITQSSYLNINPKITEQLQRIEDKLDELLRK